MADASTTYRIKIVMPDGSMVQRVSLPGESFGRLRDWLWQRQQRAFCGAAEAPRFRLITAPYYYTDQMTIEDLVTTYPVFEELGTRPLERYTILFESPKDFADDECRKKLRADVNKPCVWQGYLVRCSKRTGKGFWRRRYFVYQGQTLYWYANQDQFFKGKTAEKSLCMGGVNPRMDHEVCRSTNKENVFALEVPNHLRTAKGKDLHVLQAETPQAMRNFIRIILQHQWNIKAAIVLSVMPHLLGELDTEGIFRLAGDRNKIERIEHQIDQGMFPDFAQYGPDETHTKTGLFKRALRFMEPCLIPSENYETFVRIGRNQNIQQRAQMAKPEIMNLPYRNIILLTKLFTFLNLTSRYAERSKMQAHNLAIVIGPNILRTNTLNPLKAMDDSEYITHMTATFIGVTHQIYPSTAMLKQLEMQMCPNFAEGLAMQDGHAVHHEKKPTGGIMVGIVNQVRSSQTFAPGGMPSPAQLFGDQSQSHQPPPTFGSPPPSGMPKLNSVGSDPSHYGGMPPSMSQASTGGYKPPPPRGMPPVGGSGGMPPPSMSGAMGGGMLRPMGGSGLPQPSGMGNLGAGHATPPSGLPRVGQSSTGHASQEGAQEVVKRTKSKSFGNVGEAPRNLGAAPDTRSTARSVSVGKPRFGQSNSSRPHMAPKAQEPMRRASGFGGFDPSAVKLKKTGRTFEDPALKKKKHEEGKSGQFDFRATLKKRGNQSPRPAQPKPAEDPPQMDFRSLLKKRSNKDVKSPPAKQPEEPVRPSWARPKANGDSGGSSWIRPQVKVEITSPDEKQMEEYKAQGGPSKEVAKTPPPPPSDVSEQFHTSKVVTACEDFQDEISAMQDDLDGIFNDTEMLITQVIMLGEEGNAVKNAQEISDTLAEAQQEVIKSTKMQMEALKLLNKYLRDIVKKEEETLLSGEGHTPGGMPVPDEEEEEHEPEFRMVKALYDYAGGFRDMELHFKAGNILAVVAEADGWYYGHLASDQTQAGWYPPSYVQDV